MKLDLIKKRFILMLLVSMTYVMAAAQTNNYYYQGTYEIEVGETKYIQLPQNIYSTVILGYYPSGSWGLHDNFSNATIVSQSLQGCKVRGDKVGKNVKLTFSGNSILRDMLWSYTGYFLIDVVAKKVAVSNISLNMSSVTLEVGGTKQLSATVLPSNATDKSVSWSSSNTSVATVSSSGLVTAKSAGSATITCKADDGSGVSTTCSIKVTAIKISDISLDNSALTLSVDDTRRLSVTISPDDASDKSLTWSSSNENVVKMGTIWSGSAEVKAVGPGKAIITCAANDGSGVKTMCEVSVTKVRSGDYFTAKTIEGVEMTFWSNHVQSGTCGVRCKSSGDGTVSVSTAGSVTIPDEVEYMKVKTIYNYAFKNCKSITTVTIPNSVETIESWAFYGCEALKSITIPDNVIELGPTVFGSCTSLESVKLGKGITKIEGSLFHSCTALTTISGLEQIVYVGTNAFLGTPWLANQPDGLVYAGKVLVKYNGTIPKNAAISIKEGTTMIGGRAFEDQENLVGVIIPESVTAIGESSFSFCKNLRSIVIPKQVKEIESFAFSYCNSLRNIVSHIEEPMPISKYVFTSNPDNNIYDNATLYVPKGAKALYEKTEGWNLFKNIVEGELSPEPEPATKGDVNGDSQVNGTDLVALTNIILGKNSKTDAADVNGDGQVNGTDYVALVNIVLGRSQAPRRAASSASISIDPSFSIKAGETKEMVINLENASDEITLVQFDLRLPNGLTLKQTGGEYDINIAGRTTWRKHSLDANATNGIVRFLLASSSNATLTGTDGAIITMTITADNSFAGGDIQLENILMVTPSEKEIKQDTYSYHVVQSQPSTPTSTGLVVEPFNITAGSEAEMVIDLTNPNDEITLVQFDLRLPDGLSVKQTGGDYVYDITDRTTWRKHSLEANATGGIIRFLLASSSNATLSGTEGAIITITLKADNTYKGGTVKLENILLVTPDEKEIKPADLSYTIGSTGISSITTDAIDSNTPIYNLRGQRLAAPQKGINIIGGKKVMVK